jgi:hypothetical protein
VAAGDVCECGEDNPDWNEDDEDEEDEEDAEEFACSFIILCGFCEDNYLIAGNVIASVEDNFHDDVVSMLRKKKKKTEDEASFLCRLCKKHYNYLDYRCVCQDADEEDDSCGPPPPKKKKGSDDERVLWPRDRFGFVYPPPHHPRYISAHLWIHVLNYTKIDS